MTFDREMQRALELDGEKLRQLTGEDHGPYFDDGGPYCEQCDGSGVEVFGVTVYEPGCGFSHDSSDERPCPACKGSGKPPHEPDRPSWLGNLPIKPNTDKQAVIPDDDLPF